MILYEYLIYYHDKIIIIDDYTSNLIKLNPSLNKVDEITINATRLDLFEAISKSKALLIADNDQVHAKAYMFVQSIENNQPIELLQIFYNAILLEGSINKLDFKNGNAYVRPNARNQWLFNIDLSKAFSMYNIIKKSPSMPVNPYQLNKRKLKKHYNLNIIEENPQFLKIEFIPHESHTKYHRGYIWLNPTNYSLIKLEISGNNHNNLFKPLHPVPIMDLNFTISYNYNEFQNRRRLNYITIKYDSKYGDKQRQRQTSTEAIIHITSYNDTYYQPKFDFQDKIFDYRYISINPSQTIFNHLSNEGHILLTTSQRQYLEFMQLNRHNFPS